MQREEWRESYQTISQKRKGGGCGNAVHATPSPHQFWNFLLMLIVVIAKNEIAQMSINE